MPPSLVDESWRISTFTFLVLAMANFLNTCSFLLWFSFCVFLVLLSHTFSNFDPIVLPDVLTLLFFTSSVFTKQTIVLAGAPASRPTLQSPAAIITAAPSGQASKSFRWFGFLTLLFFSLLSFWNKVGEKPHLGLFWKLNYNCADKQSSCVELPFDILSCTILSTA